VYIIRANSLYQHLEPYKTAGIEPHQITIDPLAIHHWFTSQNNDSLGTRIGVLINCSHCVVITSVEGNFQRAHQLTLSGSDEHLLTQNIISEVRTQIDNFVLMEKREPITLLAASREQAMRLRDTLTDRLNDSEQPPTVVITTTPTIIHWGDNHEQPLQDSFAYEAVTAEGLLLMAMTSKLPHANLLPRQYIRKHQQRTFLFNASFACILSVFALVLLWVGFAATNRRIARAAKPIENQITPIQHIAQSIERKRQRLRAIRDQISSRGQITQILKELYQYTPNSISLSKFRFATSPAGVSIQIKGQAKMMANPFDYAELMQKSTLLGNLQVENVQQVPRPGGSIVEFQAQGTINKRAGT
jgi:Tfp pilus assembly protein PilN